MKTSVFEERIKSRVINVNTNWAWDIFEIKYHKVFRYCESYKHVDYKDFTYKRLVKCDLTLEDATYKVIIGQDRKHLVFMYEGFTPDENSAVCLDQMYEREILMIDLKRKY
jgi:hypothetical protein